MLTDNRGGGHWTVGLTSSSRVVVIEEDSEVRLVLRLMLEDEGYEVLEAADGAAAEAICRETPCDLAVAHCSMHSPECLRTISELRRQFPRMKIVAMSGEGADRLVAAQKVGADLTLSKPFSRLGLANVVRRAMRLPAWRRVEPEVDFAQVQAYA